MLRSGFVFWQMEQKENTGTKQPRSHELGVVKGLLALKNVGGGKEREGARATWTSEARG